MQHRITTDYGRAVGGFIVGGGYGVKADITAAVDALAELLAPHVPHGITRRCNAHGESGGAFYDAGGWTSAYGLGCTSTHHLYPGRIVYYAGFTAPVSTDMNEVPADQRYTFPDDPLVHVWSPYFETPEEALAWLMEHGRRHCPDLEGT